MLSFWSDDDSGDEESMTEPEDPIASGLTPKKADDKEGKEEKKEEKKKREEDRSKVLEQAGLKLRREAPGIPVKNRRRAPDAPGKKRRAAPGLPPSKGAGSSTGQGESTVNDQGDGGDGKMDTLDAYARYENYLAQSQAQLNQPRPQPHLPTPTSPTQSIPGNLTPTRTGRSASIISQPSSTSTSTGGGRFSGLISRIMAPSTSESQAPRKSISIVRVESDAGGDDGVKERGGGTWTSLVDPSVLTTMSDVERKRQEVSEQTGPNFYSFCIIHLLLSLVNSISCPVVGFRVERIAISDLDVDWS